ncbi:Uncharacterised protein [Mycobacteroides abscessus subsp. abscessus]|nr:Uncharacterised protein [Mycobacteroides abscessus subsp. abscessus]SKU57224.1 Uncharacterised protein [Mycobacteroides abscessus subsp. abscessus]
MTDTQSGQPSSTFTMVPRRYRLTPAMSTCATAKPVALTRCAPTPKRCNIYSGTLRTCEP